MWILCRSPFVYLATEDLEKLTRRSIIKNLTKGLLWLDFGVGENFKELLEIHFLRKRLQLQIEVILTVKIEHSRGRFLSNSTIQTSWLIF